ncbi:PREDICTED: glutamate receptor-like [Ceratosolen solmsi marchali]|uniref:Glutamate receptor-like n=1 Tax=Ceratosolen solmsi marchali TaxID=326594 RepID=A0AAJ7E013_9HYME|nr:PREDICTED: glutamate receptor-like [Ceratosolen solmsi marchali]
MIKSFYLILALVLEIIKADEIDVRFARNYFEERGIRQIAAFGCWNPYVGKLMAAARAVMLHTSLIKSNLQTLLFQNPLGVRWYYGAAQFIGDRLPFNESYFWLLKMADRSNEQLPLDLLDQLPLSINAEVTVAIRGRGRDSRRYDLYDVYNPSYRHGGSLNITKMGYWDPRGGLRNQLTQYKYKRRGDLRGMNLNFSIVVDFLPNTVDLMTYLTTPINKHLDTMHRYNYALTQQLRDYYNFTLNLLRGTTWGYLINGSFNGIVGDMINGIVDIGATPFQFKPERIDVMEYTVQAYMAKAAIIFRHPKRQQLSNSFLEPFSKHVWCLTIIIGILNWILLYITIKVEQHFIGNAANNTLLTQPESETFLITSAAICQQGLSDTPRINSGRIVYTSLFLWAMLLYQFYSASIVGSLLSEKPRFIRTIKDLADSHLEVGIENMSYNHDFFRTTSDKNVIDLFERKISLNKKRNKFPYYTAEEGLRKVQKGDFAFQVDLATAYKIITDTFNEDEICDLQEIELFAPKHTATCTSKHSPFKKMMTYGLRQTIEHGMSRRLNTIWYEKKPVCPESHNSTPIPVNLQDFSPALIMITAAYFFSICLLLVENLIKKIMHVKK